jgi:cation transport ATPase
MTQLRPVLTTLRRYAVPALALVGLAAGLTAQYLLKVPEAARLILLVTLLAGGLPVVVGTVWGMLRRKFAADIVATLAIVGAAVTGEYLAGCVIVLMQTGGEALEAYAVRRASAALEALLARAPRVAHRRHGEAVEDVPVEEVAVGDLLLVRPGELIPVDGTVLDGMAAVDASALTGEPVPVLTEAGDEVLSGSVCLDGALELRATRPSSESQHEQIVRLVRTAQSQKAPLGRLADCYAVFFTPLTLAVCALAYLLTRRPEAVVAVLVVATPCPLILATPVAIISGINRTARRGIIVKSGAAIEQIGKATAVVFDKTGTLTVGTPLVERVVALNGQHADAVLPDRSSPGACGRAASGPRSRPGPGPQPRGALHR